MFVVGAVMQGTHPERVLAAVWLSAEATAKVGLHRVLAASLWTRGGTVRVVDGRETGVSGGSSSIAAALAAALAAAALAYSFRW